ncbi:helix-turn-helix domain-containing protein [Geofilum rubicundum]|uniref:helix-turn-helix domain-containing protein n=1 Tax=Geofilum rubicundum TaxID=472113 RepID=UPI000780A5F7|nr:helix-turn-helix domain-containing protein [Geofilum rubicundum]
MKQTFTFDQLPLAIALLTEEVGELKRLLIEKQDVLPTEKTEQLLNVQGAAKFLNLTVPTIYSKVSKGELPYMKRGKHLHFSSSELMAYVKGGRKKTNVEIEQEAAAYLSNKKRAEL